AAMSTSRSEEPRTYSAYQRCHATRVAQEQETSRGWSMDDPMSKLGYPKSPPIYPESDHPIRPDKNSHRRRVRRHDQQVKKSFEQAVSEEMARGCTEEVAGQRVMQAHGYTLEHESFIAKGLTDHYAVQSRFHDLADGFVDFDNSSPRCEAFAQGAARKQTVVQGVSVSMRVKAGEGFKWACLTAGTTSPLAPAIGGCAGF